MEVVVSSESFPEKDRFCFDIISTNEEKSLSSELAIWDEYSELMRHARRASVFYQHKLYSEAVDEFDRALELSPSTDYLIADAIRAHFQLGDEDGVRSLLKRLAKISPTLYREMLLFTGVKLGDYFLVEPQRGLPNRINGAQ